VQFDTKIATRRDDVHWTATLAWVFDSSNSGQPTGGLACGRGRR